MRSSNSISDCIYMCNMKGLYICTLYVCILKVGTTSVSGPLAFSLNQMIHRQTAECTMPSSTHCVKDLLVFLLLRCWTFCLCHFCLKEVLDEMVGTETLSCFCVLYHHISKTIYMSWGSAQCVVCVYVCMCYTYCLTCMYVCTLLLNIHLSTVLAAWGSHQPPQGPGSTNMYVCTVCTSAHHIIFIHTRMSMYKCTYMQYICGCL